MPMIRLTEPQSMGELAMITSLLEGSGIPYMVQNEHVSSLYPGLPILNSQCHGRRVRSAPCRSAPQPTAVGGARCLVAAVRTR